MYLLVYIFQLHAHKNNFVNKNEDIKQCPREIVRNFTGNVTANTLAF